MFDLGDLLDGPLFVSDDLEGMELELQEARADVAMQCLTQMILEARAEESDDPNFIARVALLREIHNESHKILDKMEKEFDRLTNLNSVEQNASAFSLN